MVRRFVEAQRSENWCGHNGFWTFVSDEALSKPRSGIALESNDETWTRSRYQAGRIIPWGTWIISYHATIMEKYIYYCR